MCDCNNEINSGEIPIGPTGPQGPAGPAPLIFSESTTNLTVGTGPKSLVVTEDLAWSTGQRLRISNDDSSKVMEGSVESYTGTSLTVDVDYTIGSGSGTDWNVSITGERGATGATGATGSTGSTGPAGSTGAAGQGAYTTLTAGATPLGGTVYQLAVANSSWMSVGQIIYIQDAGYYTVTSINSAIQIVVNNPEYPGNSTASLLNTKTISAGGLQGPTGTNGTNGTDGFNYETVDGNNIPAEATNSYQVLMRNGDNTGYTWIELSDLKILLASV